MVTRIVCRDKGGDKLQLKQGVIDYRTKKSGIMVLFERIKAGKVKEEVLDFKAIIIWYIGTETDFRECKTQVPLTNHPISFLLQKSYS